MKWIASLRTGSLKWIAIFSVATNLLLIVPPLYMLQLYDRVLSSNSIETLLYISLIAIAAMCLYGVAEAVRGVLSQKAAARYTVSVSDPLFAKLSKNGGEVRETNQVLRDFNMVRQFIASRALAGLFDLPFAPFFILLMFMLHWTLGVVTVIGTVILIGVGWLNKTVTAEQSRESKQADMRALSFAQAVFARSEDIRAMGLLPAVMERWGGQMATALNSGDEAARQGHAFYGISKSARKILQVCIMGWGAWLVIRGDVSGGIIFAASMISGRALAPIEQVIGGWDRIVQARTAHDNIEEFLAEGGEKPDLIRLPDPKGVISVENLTYAPSPVPNARPVLDNVSFVAEPGQLLAIIGPSGAGKSTIAKAMVGAIEPDHGAIRLDRADRSLWPDDQWGETVGYVSQEIALFPGTIAENIARLEVKPNEEKVVHAAQRAGIHDMVASLPEGYATEIGPGKIALSGGQKQRIAFARALYSDPKVLILDEPNAHLDSQGEKILLKALASARDEGRTVIVVTQRRSMLDIADFVLTVKEGRVESYVKADKKLRDSLKSSSWSSRKKSRDKRRERTSSSSETRTSRKPWESAVVIDEFRTSENPQRATSGSIGKPSSVRVVDLQTAIASAWKPEVHENGLRGSISAMDRDFEWQGERV